MDWSPVGPSTALPGDPGTISSSATDHANLARAFSAQATSLAGVDIGQVWVGLAAQQFDQARTSLPPTLRDLARRCRAATPALRTWSGVVEDTQARGLTARDAARRADEDIAEADAGIRAISRHRTAAAQSARTWNDAHPDDPPHSPSPWYGPDWGARRATAVADRNAAQADFDDAVSAHTDGRRTATRALADADGILDDPFWAVGPLATFASWFTGGPDEFPFVVTDEGLVLNTEESWRWETYRQAGIDPAAWDPRMGLAPLDGIAVNAWEFYGDLYARNPDQFVWAGMANLAGGTFYSAFQDIHVLRRGLEDGAVAVDEIGDIVERMYPGLPGKFYDELADLAARDIDAFAQEVRYVEVTFLDMQKQIFDDLAWQHVAYEQGGMAGMEQLRDNGDLQDIHINAWRDIDSGDYDRVLQGNRDLLFHEQSTIIGDDYDEIRDHSPVTWAMTMGMSIIASSPVPGGRPFRDVVPYEIGVSVNTPDRIPLVPEKIPFTDRRIPWIGGTSINTPDSIGVSVDLPLNNVSIFDNRWRWIETDMLPAWIDRIEDGTAPELTSVPIPVQGAEQRLIPDWLLPYEP